MNDTALTRQNDPEPRAEPLAFATPAIDVFEGDRDFRVDVDLPGVRADDVRVNLEGNALEVDATRPGDRASDGHPVRYRRTIRFDVPLNGDDVRAELKAGVLALTVPKAESALPRQIPVVSA